MKIAEGQCGDILIVLDPAMKSLQELGAIDCHHTTKLFCQWQSSSSLLFKHQFNCFV